MIAQTEQRKPFSVVGVAGKPGEGPHMVIVLKILDGKIIQARYSTYGCATAEVCGQWICDEVEGKDVGQALNLNEGMLIDGVGKLPLGREHCGILTVSALSKALLDAEERAALVSLAAEIG